jgi:hypothetical protein
MMRKSRPNRKIIIRLLLAGLLAAGLAVIGGFAYHWVLTGKKPDQPIAFSHRLHIDRVGLECRYCHSYADSSPAAGIPAMSVCMRCHETVAVDRPEVQKLRRYWLEKEPIPWVKVHVQKWHVFFTHKRHTRAKIDCSTCHGQVSVMDTVRQVRPLNMGFCVTCHRQNRGPTDCLTCHK